MRRLRHLLGAVTFACGLPLVLVGRLLVAAGMQLGGWDDPPTREHAGPEADERADVRTEHPEHPEHPERTQPPAHPQHPERTDPGSRTPR